MSEFPSQPHPWDSPTHEHPEPVPLVSPSDLVNPVLTVADVMTPSPRTCSPASSVLEATLIYRDADCGIVPITEDGRPVGVLTDRDVALAVPDHQVDLASLPVGELMTRRVVAIDATAPIVDAIRRMGEEGLRRLMVVDGSGLLVGVLSVVDLFPHLSERGVGWAVSRITEHR